MFSSLLEKFRGKKAPATKKPAEASVSMMDKFRSYSKFFRGAMAALSLTSALGTTPGCNEAEAQTRDATVTHTTDAGTNNDSGSIPQAVAPIARTQASTPIPEALPTDPINDANKFGGHSVVLRGANPDEASIESGLVGSFITAYAPNPADRVTPQIIHEAGRMASLLNPHVVAARQAAHPHMHTHVSYDHAAHTPQESNSDHTIVHKVTQNGVDYYAVVVLDSDGGNELYRTSWFNPLENTHPANSVARRLARHHARYEAAIRHSQARSAGTVAQPAIPPAAAQPQVVAPVAVQPAPAPQAVPAQIPQRRHEYEVPAVIAENLAERLNEDEVLSRWFRFSTISLTGNRQTLRMEVIATPELGNINYQYAEIPLQLNHDGTLAVSTNTRTPFLTAISENVLMMYSHHATAAGTLTHTGLGNRLFVFNRNTERTETALDRLPEQSQAIVRGTYSEALGFTYIPTDRPHNLGTLPNPITSRLHLSHATPIQQVIGELARAFRRVRVQPAAHVERDDGSTIIENTTMVFEVVRGFNDNTVRTIAAHVSDCTRAMGPIRITDNNQSDEVTVTLPSNSTPSTHRAQPAVNAHQKTSTDSAYVDPDSAMYQNMLRGADRGTGIEDRGYADPEQAHAMLDAYYAQSRLTAAPAATAPTSVEVALAELQAADEKKSAIQTRIEAMQAQARARMAAYYATRPQPRARA